MKERLQKIISASGLMSRRAAEELIAAGKVSVNGATAALGDKAEAGIDRILVDGKVLPSAGEKLYIMLNKPRGYVTSPAQVDILELKGEEALLGITIHEGRNRQVRKMCEAAGLKVTRLMRVSEGGVELGTLKSGKWRRLTEEELNMLLE